MGREQPLEEFRWLSISRPRRMMIGDLMVGVAVAAFACLTLTVTLRSELSNSDRSAFGYPGARPLRLAGRAVEAGEASPPAASNPLKNTLLGIASYLVG